MQLFLWHVAIFQSHCQHVTEKFAKLFSSPEKAFIYHGNLDMIGIESVGGGSDSVFGVICD